MKPTLKPVDNLPFPDKPNEQPIRHKPKYKKQHFTKRSNKPKGNPLWNR